MINKHVPGFSFVDPKIRAIGLNLHSVHVTTGTRRLRAIWTPELAQDIQAFTNFDAEAELTALLTANIAQEIDNQIIRDLTDNQRFYQHTDVDSAIVRWNQIGGNILIHRGNRAPQDAPAPGFGGIALPMIRRVAAQTVGLDLVAVQPLATPTGLLTYLDYSFSDGDNFISLPNEEGWYGQGSFESLFIKMNMKPLEFIERVRRVRRGRRNPIRY